MSGHFLPARYVLAVTLSALAFACAHRTAPAESAPPTARSGPPPPPTTCEGRRAEAKALAERGESGTARVLARQAYADCGPGGGLAGLLGRLAVESGELEDAANYLAQDLVSSEPREGSFHALVWIYPQLSPMRQAQIAALGSTEAAPLMLDHEGFMNTWVTDVLCRGVRLDAVRSRWDHRTGLTWLTLECPPGQAFSRYFRYVDRAPPAEKPAQGRPKLAVESILPNVRGGYGIDSVDELRAAVATPDLTDRSAAWLLSWLKDTPTRARIYAALVDDNPNDLEAVVGLAQIQMELGDPEAALATLDRTSVDTAEVRDIRGHVVGLSALFTARCQALLQQNEVDAALAACRESLRRGSRVNGPHFLARALFLKGADAEALEHIRTSLANESFRQDSRYLEGAILELLADRKTAYEAFRLAPRYTSAFRSRAASPHSREDWVRGLDEVARADSALALAQCGHYYLDLGLPERAQACFRHAERLEAAYAIATRVDHEAETDAERALAHALAELEQRRHPALMRAAAAAYLALGRAQEAMHWVGEAMWTAAGEPQLDDVLNGVCAALKDPDCYATYRKARLQRKARP